ncbi:toprim domain-containing protein [Mycoplasma nasistruthionis]|uniref:Recombination protein RecR n=1 Tax=Mycoplasma nasistruthionis TaxID=353852 RepID=A0A4Y6I723_9MOLU|nr:toprim domain-containing protein [Mycoplasma nasistruthionis]QDF65191.1 recombination protein RecR [Mycoplasma nasistruthionis]
MFNNSDILQFIAKLKQIPGISKKQAEKIVYWILDNPKEVVEDIATSFLDLKDKTTFCELCANIKTDGKCVICHNPKRTNQLMIVENLQSLQKIESTDFYQGKYYVFNTLVENNGDLNKNKKQFDNLYDYATAFDEIIIAISPTLKGNLTSSVIKKQLVNMGLKVTELAIGVPLGASVDYIDPITLQFAIRNRRK